MSDVQYERKNDRIIVAKQEGEEIARIVEVPGMKAGTKRGDRVEDIDEAKQRIEKYVN